MLATTLNCPANSAFTGFSMAEQQPQKRDKKLQAMATEEEVAAFNSACKLVGLAPPDTLRRLAHAFAEQIHDRKSIRLPLRVDVK